MTKSEQQKLLKLACELARSTGKILSTGFHKSMKVKFKGRIDPVTEYDLKAEEHIVSGIRSKYPDHDLLTEEGKAITRKSDICWIVDPLDGTVNFSHGFPVYCVSIGVECEGKIIAGAVYDPERDELFHGLEGSGSFVNKKRLAVSSTRRLERALLATGFAYDIGTAKRNNLGLFARMAKQAQGIRRPGSAAIDLCWTAAGRLDGFWELKLHPWDSAAARLIVEEAGGLVSRIDGSPYSVYDDDILAANRHLHRAMSQVLTSKQ
ncbi:MAG: inositol monophosphatase family protein [candidate division Zixibacteria bacterium]